MILISAHATKPRTPISIRSAYIAGCFLIISVIITPIWNKLLNPSQSGTVLSKSTDTSTTTSELTESNKDTPWIIELDETGIVNKINTNGIRHHGDGYWYPTRKGEEGHVTISIPANYEEINIEFQVIDEKDNPSTLDPSFIWMIAISNATLGTKKQELAKTIAPEYTVHNKIDGSTTRTLENIGIMTNPDIETSINSARLKSFELPHPVIQGQPNSLTIKRTNVNGNEGIYNFNYNFKEKNENGKISPMSVSFPLSIAMPFSPLDTTSGKVDLYMGTFYGHGLKVTSLQLK